MAVRNAADIALCVGDLVIASTPPYRRVGRVVGLRPLSQRLVVDTAGSEIISDAMGWRLFARGAL